MSSIISDLFFGSKQNILDNYLINRHQAQPSSLQQKQQTVLYASFIEFVITIPPFNSNNGHAFLKIQVQMGNRSDEGFLEIKYNQKQSSSIILTLNELGKQDLNKYTNIKITISQGKYEKIHGFIPIESIKNIANSFSNQKTISVQMKGKKTFGFSTIQCTIRTEFPNNNVLNSQIMRSLQKDQSYLKSKEEISDEINQTYSPKYPKETKHFGSKKFVKNRKNESSLNQPVINRKKNSQNIIIDDRDNIKATKNNIHSNYQKITQYVKQIKSIALCFTKIQLGQLFKVLDDNIQLKLGQKAYKLRQVVHIEHITKQGINMQIIVEQEVVGFIHLGPLLLTLDKIYGQLPIYSISEQCLGTIVVESPNQQQQIQKKKPIFKSNDVYYPIRSQERCEKQMLLLSLDKIVMVNSNNSLNNSQEIDTSQINCYDFTKIELNKIEVIVRINGIVQKFTDVVLNYTFDRQFIKIVELRRKQGFTVRYFEIAEQDNLNVEVQIFSAYRLISYGKIIIKSNENLINKFMGGDTSSNIFHCGIYLKAIRLHVKTQYFQEHKINTIFNILQDILHQKIILNTLDDYQIKNIMNLHKKITYVQLKKLFVLIEKHLFSINNYQKSLLMNVYSQQKHEINEQMIKISRKLLEEFLYLDYNNQKMVTNDEFKKIIQFYKQDLEMALGKRYQQFIKNPIKMDDRIIYVFFIAGYYFEQHISSNNQAYLSSKNQISLEKPILTQVKYQSNPISDLHIQENKVKVEPSYFISKIILKNAHLLNLGKAPNITLNISKKVNYSNSNPEFVIEKQVSLLQNIKIYHKSIGQDRRVLLTEFRPQRRQTYYELQPSGKCFAKIIWNS